MSFNPWAAAAVFAVTAAPRLLTIEVSTYCDEAGGPLVSKQYGKTTFFYVQSLFFVNWLVKFDGTDLRSYS